MQVENVAIMRSNDVHSAGERHGQAVTRLQVIICSTRPGRLGPTVARWFCRVAHDSPDFEVEAIDLRDYALPLFDEPVYPLLRQYRHAHTKRWSAAIARGDAYVFVMPEYNSSPPPALTNAIDFLYQEWNYKPCAFVCYGGEYGGLHAVQMARMQATTVKMMPLIEVVSINRVYERINEAGELEGSDARDAAARRMLAELARWSGALRTLRADGVEAPR